MFMQYGESPKVNFNIKEVYKILDIVSGLLCQSDFIKHQQLIAIYQENNLYDRIDLLIEAFKNYV